MPRSLNGVAGAIARIRLKLNEVCPELRATPASHESYRSLGVQASKQGSLHTKQPLSAAVHFLANMRACIGGRHQHFSQPLNGLSRLTDDSEQIVFPPCGTL